MSEDGSRAGERRPRRARPTMADVAAKVGVSRALVSLVFRNEPGASKETRDRVFQAAEELGYRPDSAAQMLARSRSKVLGVMLTVRNPFHADLVEGIYPVAEELGYDILLSAAAPTRDERKAVEALLSHRCEALMLLGPKLESRDLAQLAERIPVVVLGRRFPGVEVDSVHTAEAKGVRQVIDHLVELGHADILHIDGGRGAGSVERRRAYRAAMRRHGLADRIRVLPGDHTEESGAQAAATLLADRENLPTAVFASNDRCALGFLDFVWRAGLQVPDDLSVVGFDDSHLAHLSHIDLTTVRQDPDRQAELAVRVVVERLSGERSEARELVLDPKFVARGTTGPPPGRG
ncbi:LacI family transcriptional regulator [Prauserella shujinwangii]|uniref:LacI family transcriptional regulator n=1 Tax=Prauserella shujinwangii TaxID=1453103 RepID=A0A2T0LW01_9PSEU|nr:LacI family DNA-binding transcriptional regulator [Prauserella shujinwangii]PRX48198.1 LacI family transcriptional regulator [Prauserella shujinwangii]